MMHDKDLMKLLCIECGGDIGFKTTECLECKGCGRTFLKEEGAWSFLQLPLTDRHFLTWERRMALFKRWRRERSALSRPPAGTSLLEEFASFADICSGTVLDIGCGSGEIRRYLRCDEYWGIDPTPLGGDDFPLFKAIGERLPFKEDSFDHVLLSQVLDHCADPSCLLREASRVVRRNGFIHVLQYGTDQDNRFIGYLIAKMRRFLKIPTNVHSWETKLNLFTFRDVRRLIEQSIESDNVTIDETLHDSQIFATIRLK